MQSLEDAKIECRSLFNRTCALQRIYNRLMNDTQTIVLDFFHEPIDLKDCELTKKNLINRVSVISKRIVKEQQRQKNGVFPILIVETRIIHERLNLDYSKYAQTFPQLAAIKSPERVHSRYADVLTEFKKRKKAELIKKQKRSKLPPTRVYQQYLAMCVKK